MTQHPSKANQAASLRSRVWAHLSCTAASMALLSCTDSAPTPESAGASVASEPAAIAVVAKNGTLSDGLPIRYEMLDSPRLAELREQENLDTVVTGAASEFERMLRLKNWVAEQWPHSTPRPYPPWDAIVILDWIRSGRTGGFCGQYSQVLLQAYAAMGYAARYVEIGSHDNPYAHFVVEVWSNQFDKWVLMDADYNLHYERDGVPMSALEIHDALISGEHARVVPVLGDFREGHPTPESWPLRTVELYYYVRVLLKANHLSVPGENPFDRLNDTMEWQDEHIVAWEVSTVDSPYPKEALTSLRTDDREAFEAKLNQVSITAESEETGVLLRFEHNVEQFLHYQVRERTAWGAPEEWRDYDAETYSWAPSISRAVVEVRGVNISGIPGPSAAVVARFIPPERNGGPAHIDL